MGLTQSGEPFKKGTRSKRDSPAAFEEVSCHDVKGPVRGPHGREMQGPLGAKQDPWLTASFKKAGTLVLKLKGTQFCQYSQEFARGLRAPGRNAAWMKCRLQPCETLR